MHLGLRVFFIYLKSTYIIECHGLGGSQITPSARTDKQEKRESHLQTQFRDALQINLVYKYTNYNRKPFIYYSFAFLNEF